MPLEKKMQVLDICSKVYNSFDFLHVNTFWIITATQRCIAQHTNTATLLSMWAVCLDECQRHRSSPGREVSVSLYEPESKGITAPTSETQTQCIFFRECPLTSPIQSSQILPTRWIPYVKVFKNPLSLQTLTLRRDHLRQHKLVFLPLSEDGLLLCFRGRRVRVPILPCSH